MNNSASPARPDVALIAGPTASGKSALAMAVAEKWNGVVINADASQVYRDLRILSARPSADEEVRVPHRLFGHVDGALAYSAPTWASEARATIDEVIAGGQLPVLVGGTGLYLRTLLEGIAPVPAIDPAIRADVRTMPVAAAYEALAAEDREVSERIRPSDTTRVARALEVIRSTGRSIAAWQSERAGGIADHVRLVPVILLPDREWLNNRIDQRLATMFATGARDEVAALLSRTDIAADAPVRRAIGVGEIARWITGEWDEATALSQASLASRQYAKRQYTWFRNQPPTWWTRTSKTDSNEIINLIEINMRY